MKRGKKDSVSTYEIKDVVNHIENYSNDVFKAFD